MFVAEYVTSSFKAPLLQVSTVTLLAVESCMPITGVSARRTQRDATWMDLVIQVKIYSSLLFRSLYRFGASLSTSCCQKNCYREGSSHL
ncbi:hypothetical protein DFH09DRAFT_135266 [Mycena vulgaris]|nr:hypothetical protein DFH09DRAFT_135266 [Mycena vulgaris]